MRAGDLGSAYNCELTVQPVHLSDEPVNRRAAEEAVSLSPTPERGQFLSG